MKNKTGIVLLATIAAVVLISSCFRDKTSNDEKQPRIGLLPSTADILFASNRDTGTRRLELYAMAADGGNVTRITFTAEHHFISGFDRSRRYILTSRAVIDTKIPNGLGNEDRRSLWVIDLETKNETQLTDLHCHAEGDTFSPDGQWIVFLMKLKDDGQLDIYKIRRDGSELTRLTNTETAVEGDPSWSNDGSRIAFTYIDGLDKNPRYILKTMDVNGGDIKTVNDIGMGVTIKGVWPPGNYDPSWSPDDRWIVFEQAFEDSGGNWGSGNWHILKVRENGNEVVDLSLAGGHTDRAEYLPSFSPDGEKIVFGSIYQAENPKDSHNDIFIMDSDGKSLKRLTYDPANDMYPVWIHSDE